MIVRRRAVVTGNRPDGFPLLSSARLLVFKDAIATGARSTPAAPNAIWPSFYAEMFDARVRYSGTAIGTQLGFLAAGFTPLVAQSLVGEGPHGWIPVAAFVAGCCVVSAISAATARETHTVDIGDLGRTGSKPRHG